VIAHGGGTVAMHVDSAVLERTARCDLDAAVRIHDQVVPRLCAVARVLAAGGDIASELCTRLHDEMTAALLDLRAVLLATPAAPATLSLTAAVREWQAEGVPVELTRADGVETPKDLERLVFDIAAEAVRNALRHGDPTAIRIRAIQADGRLVVSISSNGAARTAGGSGLGLGLSLASAAAERHGGRLDWGPAGEDEWLVRLMLPVADRSDSVISRRPTGEGSDEGVPA
jgi:signal transduction histidine kinase